MIAFPGLVQRRGYVVADREADAWRWRVHCESARIPFLCVLPWRTWAWVELDMRPSGFALEDATQARLWDLLEGFSGDFHPRSGAWHVGRREAWVYRVRSSVAQTLAGFIADAIGTPSEWALVDPLA